MKKIRKLPDPFYDNIFIDLFGLFAIVCVLRIQGMWGSHLIVSSLVVSFLVLMIGYRSLWTIASLTIQIYCYAVRVRIYNINMDIKITREFVKNFGRRPLYLKRIILLKLRKYILKKAVDGFVNLFELLCRSGYDFSALMYVMENVHDIMEKINKLVHSKRQRFRKK